jgi:SAM-dependent methyltransferase
MDRHELYELMVQSPGHAVALLRAIHGGEPRVLGEDFSGTAAVSREWVRTVRGGSAIAVDYDKGVLARAGRSRAIRKIVGDVRTATKVSRDRADVIFVGNFSIGELHERGDLVAYLRHAKARLKRGGAFVCDTYGGESAFRLGSVRRERVLEDGRRVLYTWEQREADPLTGRVINALHFRVLRGREVEVDLPDAFVYDWRLWSVPELRDAMSEAGFVETAVYGQLPDAVDSDGNAHVLPIDDPDELGESFIVCVAGRLGTARARR